MIYAIQNGNANDAKIVIDAIQNGNRDAFNDVYAVVQRTQAITYTERRADEEAEKAIAALAVLPESEYKDALIQLAKFSVQRNF